MVEEFLKVVSSNLIDVLKLYIANNLKKYLPSDDPNFYSSVFILITTILTFLKYENIKSYREYRKQKQLDELFKDYWVKDTVYLIKKEDKYKFSKEKTYPTNTEHIVYATNWTFNGISLEKYYEEMTGFDKKTFMNDNPYIIFNKKVLYITSNPVIPSNFKGYFYETFDKNIFTSAYAQFIRDKTAELVPKQVKKMICFEHLTGNEIQIPEHITFETLFSKEVKKIQTLVENFMSGKIIKKFNNHAPNNIGVLMHGPAGTGKSSVISAMANKTGRCPILANLSEMKSAKEFSDLINGRNQSYEGGVEHYIFVFEELDTVKAVLNRDLVKHDEKTPESDTILLKKQMLLKASEKAHDLATVQNILTEVDKLDEKSKNNNALTLGTILTELSGVGNTTGRIIVATTNYPHLLDKALIRPGRFDIISYLGYLDDEEATDLAFDIFKNELNPSDKREVHLGETKITPAEFINKAIYIADYVKFVESF